jgi:hypothetical protein
MKSLRLHVTDLDSWRWYHIIEDRTENEFISGLLRLEPANEKMLMGTAWHSILENPPDEISKIKKNGFTFICDIDAEVVLPQVREIRAQKVYEVDGYAVTLTGGCDGITGNKIVDHKLTFNPNVDNYLDAYQWRAYLDIYNADVFEYRIYHGYQSGMNVTIKDYSTLRVCRYPTMVDDLLVGVRGLLRFVVDRVPQMILPAVRA